MSNDVSRITDSTLDDLLAINIWWPAVVSRETYERLAHKRPDMLGWYLRACIAADYQEMWDKQLVSSFSGPTRFHIETESTGNETEGKDIKRKA